MAWKKKEIELHPKEAIRLAREELEPYWYGSEPLFAACPYEDKMAIFPISDRFKEKTWLVSIFNPYSLEGLAAIQVVKEWNRRYQGNSIAPLNILVVPQKGLATKKNIQRMLSKNQIPGITVLDVDEAISSCYPSHTIPKTALIENAATVFVHSGPDWISQTEGHLQRFLHSTDPGIPFEPILKEDDYCNRVEKTLTLADLKPLTTGKWTEDQGALLTTDNGATLTFEAEGKAVYVLAETRQPDGDRCKIAAEVNNAPILEWFAGKDLNFDENGTGYLGAFDPRQRSLIIGGPSGKRVVKLSFPSASRSPVAIYSIVFAER